MEGTPGDNLRKQLEEREAEVVDLRDRLEQAESELEQAESEIDRLRKENDQLRKELKAAGRGKSQQQSKRKAKRKRPGRKAGQGPFTYRGAPPKANPTVALANEVLSSLSFVAKPSDNGSTYRLLVGAKSGVVMTRIAKLTVVADTVKPVVSSVASSMFDPT